MPEHIETRNEESGVGEPGIVIVHGTTSGLVQDIVVGPHHLTAEPCPARWSCTSSCGLIRWPIKAHPAPRFATRIAL